VPLQNIALTEIVLHSLVFKEYACKYMDLIHQLLGSKIIQKTKQKHENFR
jgi:hypothetical protein